jgi:hypothetical protein
VLQRSELPALSIPPPPSSFPSLRSFLLPIPLIHPSVPHSWSGEFDDYDQWFATELPGKDPQATLDGLDGDGWNSWHGRAYVYDEYYHPTAWLGRTAVSFIKGYDATPEGQAGTPYFLKVSFHRCVC